MIMKRIPNILTVSRIILALILLLLFREASPLFIALYATAMLTDLLDGFLARKIGACSPRGALLDTVADFLLDANLLKLVLINKALTKKLFVWLIAALCIGAVSPIVNYIKHKKVFFIHSIPCKLCMWAFLVVPFAIRLGFIDGYLVFVLSLITLAMIELVVISLLLKEPNENALSIYSVLKKNKALKI